jgi:sec-independent protein translocase protein TatA
MGFGELVLILTILVVVFGATKLPQLGDGLGAGIKRFRDQMQPQAPRVHLVLRRTSPRRWTVPDWLLAISAAVAVAAAIANGLLLRR